MSSPFILYKLSEWELNISNNLFILVEVSSALLLIMCINATVGYYGIEIYSF